MNMSQVIPIVGKVPGKVILTSHPSCGNPRKSLAWSLRPTLRFTGKIQKYRKTSNIIRTFVGNKIVDNSDVVGASPIGAAPTTSSFST